MKIKKIHIKNFKAIKEISIDDLKETVVIAGPNGCGKSCILDAIRLLKSIYGGHNPNEWHQWFGEFQIPINKLGNGITSILNSKNDPLLIEMELILRNAEKKYIEENLQTLVNNKIWKTIMPPHSYGESEIIVPTNEYRFQEANVNNQTLATCKKIQDEIKENSIFAKLTINPDGTITTNQCATLELCFSEFIPEHIGIIDYHSANRTYNRESLDHVSLNISNSINHFKNHVLYNSAGKYQNIKQEIASAYIKELLIKDSGHKTNKESNLINTLKELFKTFFPGKTFLGPQSDITGKLSFPIQLDSGSVHDINDLSSGEKEILYGYLRLQQTSPKNSVFLLDEPELHLNPRLLKGLVNFYRKHIGSDNNQIFMVTHSDTILRESMSEPECSVFHMKSLQGLTNKTTQISEISENDELEAALSDLVGDLASYIPNSKLIIFEGGGESDFDVRVVSELFPEIVEKANLISGNNRAKVTELHDILEKAKEGKKIHFDIYSITDLDNKPEIKRKNQYTWDVYSIENYLINPEYIKKALDDILDKNERLTISQINEALETSARNNLKSLIEHEMRTHINKKITSRINLNINKTSNDYADEFKKNLDTINKEINELSISETYKEIKSLEDQLTKKYENHLNTGDWKKTFRGRDILKSFSNEIKKGLKYEKLRNLIISRMRDNKYQPQGMKDIIEKIIDN